MKEVVISGHKGLNPRTGAKVVGTSAASITEYDSLLKFGVQIVAATANTHPVYVSLNPNLTAGTNAVTSGIGIPPGSGLMVPADQASKIYAIAAGADQNISFMAY